MVSSINRSTLQTDNHKTFSTGDRGNIRLVIWWYILATSWYINIYTYTYIYIYNRTNIYLLPNSDHLKSADRWQAASKEDYWCNDSLLCWHDVDDDDDDNDGDGDEDADNYTDTCNDDDACRVKLVSFHHGRGVHGGQVFFSLISLQYLLLFWTWILWVK